MEIAQRFEDRYRVRFDEADASGRLRPSGLLRYAQDLAWRHSEAAGFDRDWYEAHDSFWLVRSVELSIEAGIGYGDEIIGTTEVTGWRRVWARRHTTFKNADGKLVATAETDWVLLTSAGRPMRIPDEIVSLLAPGRTYRPQKVELGPPPPDASTTRLDVRDADVDPLGHLNNAAFLDMADEAIPRSGESDRPPTSCRAEYVRPALRGTSLDVATWPTSDGSRACRFTQPDGEELFRALLR